MERVGHRTALLARVATFIGLRKTEDMREVWAGDKAGVSVGPNKENSEQGANDLSDNPPSPPLEKRGWGDLKLIF
jgi:hypothetical protein